MTTINRATWTDDDGSGMTGTIINNARLQGDVYDKVDGALATLDAKDTSQDAAIAANGPHSILSASHTDTVPAGLSAGDVLIVNAAGKLVRLPKSTDGTLLTLATGLPAWVPLGAWTDVPFNAANFTADTGTWVVDAGDVSALRWMALGKMAVLVFAFVSTVTTGAPPALRFIVPGFPPTLAGTTIMPCSTYTGAWNVGIAGNTGGGGATQIYTYPNPARGAWPAYANVQMSGTMIIPLA